MMSNKHEKKKTIFYLRTSLDAADLCAGGSVAHTLGVLEGFLKKNFRVLCASSAMIRLLKELNLEQFLILRQPKIFAKLGFRLNCFISNFFFIPRSLFFLRKKNIEFVYQRSGLLNFTGLAIAKLKRVPLVLEFNGSDVWIDKHWQNPDRFRVSFLIRWVERWNIRGAKKIVVVSDALRAFLVDAGVDEQKILVNPNGVDAQAFDPEKLIDARKEIRTALALHNKFVFGFVGSFGAWHGIETLAAMIPEVIEKYPHAHFLLIGSGNLFPYFKNELARANIGKEFVTLTGTVMQHDAKKYLAACDAFLSPTKFNKDGSRFFGSPTKMFEYMSLGKPIIASDLEQLSELLEPALKNESFKNFSKNEVGVLVRPDDVQGFVDAACRLIELDADKQAVLGRNARQKVVKQYSWDKNVEKTIDFVYQDKNCS